MGEKVFLNVASGPYVLKDFVNLDNSLFLRLSTIYPFVRFFLSDSKKTAIEQYINARKEAKLVRHNCSRPFKFAAASVDHILCSHFLEHLYHDTAYEVMKEFARLLKPGGTLHVIVPDLEVCIQDYLGDSDVFAADKFMGLLLQYNEQGPSMLHRILDFGGGLGLTHLWMYDRKSMSKKLQGLGFVLSNELETPSSFYRKDDRYSLHVSAKKN